MARAKDSNTGLVELFNQQGGRIRSARYNQVSYRKGMVEGWLKECSGPGYTLVITPDIELPYHEMGEILREERWRELKRKMGISPEKTLDEDLAGADSSAESNESDSGAPSCHDLRLAVHPATMAQIDRKIEQLSEAV
jgi:hypothetical protein